MRFNNKVVIITGGSSGIGESAAIAFTKEGAKVVIVGRNEDNLHKVAGKCSEVGKSPLTVKADVTKDNESKNVIDKTIEAFGKLDILVNNAGIFRHALLSESHYVETYDAIMKINARAAFVLTHLALPHLLESKGNVVNISSTMSDMNFAGYSAYCSSKAALKQFTRVTANELAQNGVRVNSISPGPVATHLFDECGADVTWNYLKTFTALDNVLRPEEVVELILYLASDNARSVTGSNFVIDSGATVKTKIL